MNKLLLTAGLLVLAISPISAQLTAPGVKWADSYSFDKVNIMKIDFYAKGNELMRTYNYKTYFNGAVKETVATPAGPLVPKGNFAVMMDVPMKGNDMETVFDMTNEVAIQIIGSDAQEPMYNAGGWKYPSGQDLKKLELVATEETKEIAGVVCKRYTYTHKQIFGSVWIAPNVKLPNDYGIFRAAKMAALHHTLSVDGFVMEMTSEDARGGKTIMTTVSLENSEKHTVNMPKSKMGTAINKVSYFTF